MSYNKSTNTNPLISIIIPSFNRESLIVDTLNSIINQTDPNWEAIIVDDGSMDNTVEVIQEYCQKDNRFRFYKRHRDPKGAPTCRNIGIENANGEYIIFLDSDDILFPKALERRISFMNSNLQLDFCVSNGIRGEYPINKNNTYKIISTYRSKDVLKEFFNFTPPWLPLNPTYRKQSLIDNHISWDENIKGFQDIDFHTQIIIKNLKFEYIDSKPDCLWTIHNEGNIGRSIGKNGVYFQQQLYILNKYKKISDRKSDIKQLTISILRSYYQTNLPDKVVKPTWAIIKDSCFKVNTFSQILLKAYRFAFNKKIAIIPRVISTFLLISGNKKIIGNRENNHFLKKRYTKNLNVLIK